MAEVLDFLRRQQQHYDLERDFPAVGLGRGYGRGFRSAVVEAGDVESFRTVQPKILCILAILELAGQHAHADQIGAVDTLEAFGDHGFDAKQNGPFRRPVARRAGAVFLAGQHHSGTPSALYFMAAS